MSVWYASAVTTPPGTISRSRSTTSTSSGFLLRLRHSAHAADDEITTGSDGIVTVLLGGSSLAVVLDWCHEMQSVLNQDSERAIGKRGGLAISRALDNLTPCDGRTRSTTVIWLDDQIAVENPTSTP